MITLLEVHALLDGTFARRIEAAALVAAAQVEWTAPDWESAAPAERASRSVLQGADLSNVVLRAAVEARSLNLGMRGTDDIEVSDEVVIDFVSQLLLDVFGS